MLVGAFFLLGFGFERYVDYPAVVKRFLDRMLYFGLIGIGYDMHRCVIAVAVHTPDVDMVDVGNAVELHQFAFYFIDIDALGCFDEEEVERLL